jgi:adenylate cyclase
MSASRGDFTLKMGRKKKLIPVILGLVTTVVFWSWHLFVDQEALRDIGNLVFDEYQRQKPREYVEPEIPVRVVDIDDESLEKYGQFPWPRTLIGELAWRLNNAGAKVVAFDMAFSEPDRTSPENIVPLLTNSGLSQEQLAPISELPSHDESLGLLFRQMRNIVTGFFTTRDGEVVLPKKRPPGLALGSGRQDLVGVSEDADPLQAIIDFTNNAELTRYTSTIPTLPVIERGARGNGVVSIDDPDGGIIRRAPLLMRVDKGIYPSLTIEAIRVAKRQQNYTVITAQASGELGADNDEMAAMKIADVEIPTTPDGQMFVHYTKRQSERVVPAWRVLAEDMTPAELEKNFKDAIIFVGTSAPGLLDLRATPLEPVEAGVLIHAQMTEQMLLGHHLTQSYAAVPMKAIIILLGGIALSFLLAYLGPLRGSLFTILVLGGLVWYSWYSFSEKLELFDPVFPFVALLTVSIITAMSSFYLTQAEREHIKDAFDLYLSPEMVDKIADDPSLLSLGGEERDLTILFLDIRGFSRISEGLSPQELTSFLNNFLTPMTDILMDHKSTVDKYIGDAIVSFWNAPLDDPDHHANAARGSLKMLSTLAEMNTMRESDPENAPLPVDTQIGIGVNSGLCSVGNMGSEQRFAYSVLGDAVNLASRLEGLTKQYRVGIIIGDETASKIPQFAHIELDQLRVVGRETPETIHALVGEEADAQSEAFGKLQKLQSEFLEAYRNRRWDDADTIANEAQFFAKDFGIAGYYDMMKERIAGYRRNAPEQSWKGVYSAQSK